MALVEIDGLTKSFGDVLAVAGISATIGEGRCVALLGPNGAGKTTTLNMLAGLLQPTAGTIRFQGVPADSDHRGLIGYLPQQVAIYGWMTGLEVLRLVGELFGYSRAAADARAHELLGQLGLESAMKRRVGGYSGGMRQRLGLAQALIHRPRLLILDEPVSGLDPVGRRQVLELLRSLKAETTILFSTHVLPDAEEVSDDILIIRAGEIIVAESLAALRDRHEQPIVEVEFDSPAGLESAREMLSGVGDTCDTRDTRGAVLRCSFADLPAARAGAAAIYRAVAGNGLQVRRVELGQTTLEEMFLEAVRS